MAATPQVPLTAILREWGRIGCIGFGGPPSHIALLRELCVRKCGWLTEKNFEDAIAGCNVLPGPASTQLAIYCAWRLRGRLGALVGGFAFIVPGLILITVLAAVFLSSSPPRLVLGAGAGAGAAVAAVALHAGWGLVPPSWARAGTGRRTRWIVYLVAGCGAAAAFGPWLVLVLLACGGIELALRLNVFAGRTSAFVPVSFIALAAGVGGGGGLLALVWVAFKVGALSYGGGFVIIPLMQADAVSHYHWLTGGQFLNAVALGQITPGPVVQTVAAVGYAAAGVGGALVAALVAFTPSFAFIALGGRRFDLIRQDERAGSFLDGAGPAAIGAIIGSAVPLTQALQQDWQYAVLAGATASLFLLRRGVVLTLLLAGAAGAVITLAGGPLPR